MNACVKLSYAWLCIWCLCVFVCVCLCTRVFAVCMDLHTCAWSVSGVLAGFGTLLGSTLPRQPVGRDKLWHVCLHTHIHTRTQSSCSFCSCCCRPTQNSLFQRRVRGEVRRGRWKRSKRRGGRGRGREMLEMREEGRADSINWKDMRKM